MVNITMNEGQFASLTSTSQNPNAASKIDMVSLYTQTNPLPPRVPGLGAEYILHVAPDFDASLDLANPQV
jgi:hypothetical protein